MAASSFLRLFSALLALLCINNLALAQVYTTTLPWIDGNTVVVSQSTNALGATIAIQTLSTVAAVDPTAVTTAKTSKTTNPLLATTTALSPLLATTTAAVDPLLATTTDDDDPLTVVSTTSTTSKSSKKTTTSAPAIVATPTTATLSTTSWYWFTSDGDVYSTWFSPTFTTALSATPAPAGTIIAYSDYQSSINAAAASSGGVNAVLGSTSSASKVLSDARMLAGAVLAGGMVVVGGAWIF